MFTHQMPSACVLMVLSCSIGLTKFACGQVCDEAQKLIASDAAADDRYGTSVAIDGDTGIVGAFAQASDAGAAYIVTRTDGSWTEQQKLTASDAIWGERFGWSVSMSGDTAIVGAPYHGFPSTGAAYIFSRINETWIEQQKLIASNARSGDRFGHSVAIDGDTAIVGAYQQSEGEIEVGAAYVFVRVEDTWIEQQRLIAFDAAEGDEFGWSVAVSGDVAFVGGLRHDSIDEINTGAVYVFSRKGETWTFQQKLIASDAVANDRFGYCIDLNGDTAIVGSDGHDAGGINSAGAAYVFESSGESWVEHQKIAASDAAAFDYFGRSVSLSGDLVIVGSYGHDPKGISNAGAVYRFTRSGGVWTQQGKLTAFDAGMSDWFGYSVALSGDAALVGAVKHEHGGLPNAGTAYVFDCVESGGECAGDLTGSGEVGVADLLKVLAAWGPCPRQPSSCNEDFDEDGSVGVADLLFLLNHWGTCE